MDARIAEMLIYCDNDDLANEVLSEISKSLVKNDTAHETTGVKNISAFLETISAQTAKTLLTQMPNVIKLLDCEAYQLRNAAVVIMANIVMRAFAGHEEVEDADSRARYDEQKTRLIKLIMKRNRDKSAFARAKALHVLADLVEKNMINETLHLDCLLIACNRIKDVASNVRRKAMQLLWKEIVIFASVILKGDKFLTRPDLLSATIAHAKALEALDREVENKEQARDEMPRVEMERQQEKSNEDKNEEEDKDKESEARQKHRAMGEHYALYEKFLTQIDTIVPSLIQLLGSKNASDVVESIKLLTSLYKRNVPLALVQMENV
jgi:condensin complex subunit 1